MQSIPEKGFEDFLKDFSGLLKFHAVWCAPCRLVSPFLEEIADETGVQVYGVDVDERSEVAAKFGVNSVPTVVAFQNGQVVGALIGAQVKAKYVELAEKSQPALEE